MCPSGVKKWKYNTCVILEASRGALSFPHDHAVLVEVLLPAPAITYRASQFGGHVHCREVRLTYFKLQESSPAEEASLSVSLRKTHPEQMDMIWIYAWI